MDIETFVERSLGEWRSQRSAHHLAFAHFEEVLSTINIESMSVDAPGVLELCQRYEVSPDSIVSPFRMSWKGESDWDEEQVIEGSTILVPVPTGAMTGKLLREQGYAETMESMGTYTLTDDGTFILTTAYERAAAEEKIWFATPNLRFRVSLIKTSSGKGVTTASFSSEVRRSASS
ncbi:phycobiliprotein lyase [Leptolyngbya cf. ectocarpi LEGE 11479]|uniref:Chromophore lyase CpcS/CpeS n=1 Tax=Leptolyngbya cf. ectocarpi LEGE 11479 TaxID=1828722 RepID=A0A929F9W4_LEPEC|nr:phycobiliprotein lyase [Leptolyngbya ectocarpi]MBE9068077.1 phycobiliprotein lyase [Leptolyngbya cf. ectocarpi LEGE 11479]